MVTQSLLTSAWALHCCLVVVSFHHSSAETKNNAHYLYCTYHSMIINSLYDKGVLVCCDLLGEEPLERLLLVTDVLTT